MIDTAIVSECLELSDEQLYMLIGGSESDSSSNKIGAGAVVGTVLDAPILPLGGIIGGAIGHFFPSALASVLSSFRGRKKKKLILKGEDITASIKKRFKSKICALKFDKNYNKIEMILGVATIISTYYSDITAVAGATIIVRAGFSEFCKDWEKGCPPDENPLPISASHTLI